MKNHLRGLFAAISPHISIRVKLYISPRVERILKNADRKLALNQEGTSTTHDQGYLGIHIQRHLDIQLASIQNDKPRHGVILLFSQV